MLVALLESVLFAFCVSFFVSLVIVATRSVHGHLTLDGDAGVQKIHTVPTPRVGGIPIYLGALIGGISLPAETQSLWWVICGSMLPAFLAGLFEDFTKRVGVKMRLLATIVSGLAFSLLSGYLIVSVDVPALDWMLSFYGFALLFTAVAIGGVANAINIIDGVHGLASGTSIIVLASLGYVAYGSGDAELLGCIAVGGAVLCGFFLLNFPFGKLFLGDAGAYSIGFLLAIISIALPLRNPEVSPLIGLVALSYPVTETLFSIWRRTKRVNSHPGQADRLHLHSLVFRDRARRLSVALGIPHLRNPMTSVIVWVLPLLSGIMTIFKPEDSRVTIVEVVFVAFVYIWLYRSVALLPSPFRPMAQDRSERTT